jgi:prepilin-type N-terminal cleavage/methylation domain-containing protein
MTRIGYKLQTRNADFQSAVSQNSFLLGGRHSKPLRSYRGLPIENRRYSRLKICVTSSQKTAFSTYNLQPATCNNSSGFTLVEILVVCLIIAVMAALIIPEMRGSFDDAVLRSSGRNLIDVLNVTYSRSVSLNQLHRLHLDKHTGRYVIEKQVGEGQEDSDFEPANEISGFSGQIDRRISIELQKSQTVQTDDSDSDAESDDQSDTPSDSISFYPDGTADARDILLRDRMGFQLALQVNPNTGRVSILEANSKLE